MSEDFEKELPKYQSHKKVWALKIKSIEIHKENSGEEGPGATITPEEDGYAPFEVSNDYIRKHDPKPGGYYVVYEDGYKSWSPAKAFEEGYTGVEVGGMATGGNLLWN